MRNKIEVDLKGAAAIGDRRGRKPARADVERHVPGMVQPGRALQADLADDLAPELQRFTGLAPRGGRQFRPCDLMRITHVPTYTLSSTFPKTIPSKNEVAGHDPARPLMLPSSTARWCGNHELVLSGQPRRPRVARKRLRQYQRRIMASIGLRTSWAINRISTMAKSFWG